MMYKQIAIVFLSFGNLHCMETKPKDVWEDVSDGVKKMFDDISDIELKDLIDTLKDGSSDVLDWLDKQVDILKDIDLDKLLNKIQYKKVFDWVNTHSTMTYEQLQDLLNMIHTTGKNHAPKVQKFIEGHIDDMSATWAVVDDTAMVNLNDLVAALDDYSSELSQTVLDWVNDQINKEHEDKFQNWIRQATEEVGDQSTAVWEHISSQVEFPDETAIKVQTFIHDHIDDVLDWSTTNLQTVIAGADDVGTDVLDWLNKNMNEQKLTNWIKDGHKMATDELDELWELLKTESHGSLSTEITNVNEHIQDHIDEIITGTDNRWDELKSTMSGHTGTAQEKAEAALTYMADAISP